MLRRANAVVGRARERIRIAAEHDPHGWHRHHTEVPDTAPEHDDDDLDGAPDGAPDETGPATGATRPPLGSPEPGAPDLDGAIGPGGVSGPPGAGPRDRRRPRRPVGDDSV